MQLDLRLKTRSAPRRHRRTATSLIRLSLHRPSLLGFLAIACLFFSERPANAQFYVRTEISEPYVPLASIPGIQSVTPVAFTSSDENYRVPIDIGFTFDFLGSPFTQIGVSTNGWIGFGPAVQSSDFSNDPIPNANAPNNMIAAWWDDLDLQAPLATRGNYGILGTAPNRVFVIEVTGLRYFGGSTTDDGSWQIRLYEGIEGRFEVRLGGTLASPFFTATSGYEGANATVSEGFTACGASGSCTATDFASMVDRTYRVQRAIEPELTGAIGAFPRGAFPGETAVGAITLRNLGVDTATTVISSLYLSSDNTLDASDPVVGTITVNGVVGGDVPITRTATLTVPAAQPVGDYFLLLEVDAPDDFREVSENNNIVAATTPFATAVDLQPSDVRSAAGANPGDPIRFDVTIANAGILYAGPVTLRLLASPDQIIDVNDPSLGDVTVTLAGIASETVGATVVLPQLAPGSYFPVVQVDSTSQVVEVSEVNNSLTGAATFPTGPDLAIAAVTPPAQAQPGAQISITTRIDSAAVPFNGAVAYRLVASLDENVDPQDTDLGTFSVSFAGDDFIDDTRTVTFPAQLPPNRYFVLAVADPANALAELNEMNNARASTVRIVNGADLSIGTVMVAPPTAEAGQDVTLTSSLLSLGVPYTGDIVYRVFLSVDDVFDPGDDPIHEGTVFLAGLNSAAINTTFRLSNTAFVQTYRVIVVADPENAITEAIEDNNANVSDATFSVLGADLRVVDISGSSVGFIGLPYRIQLTVENDGVATARGFRYAYYISDNDIIRVTDPQIFLSGTATIAPGQQQSFSDMVTLPTFTSTQTKWLGVILDIFSQVPENSEGNNIARIQMPVGVVFPIPDLTATIVGTATAAAAGEELAITRVLLNPGVADAPAFEYTYYLSTNPTVSTDDIPIGTFSSNLGIGEDDFGFDGVSVPSDVPAGTYYVGMVIDPEDRVLEIDEGNNATLGPQIPVFAAAIQFLTERFSDATIGVPYEVGVYARGGPLGLTWSVRSGSLPDGLSLDMSAGIISGTPTREGLFAFVLRALSGTAYADKSFTLRVTAPTVPLRVATPTLQTAVVGRPYTIDLVAVGGVVPYEWSAVSTLPSGLQLSPGGRLSGTPQAPGNHRLTIRVRDALDNSASKELALNIINASQAVSISQLPLPSAVAGLDYCMSEEIALEATGGLPPYTWSAVGQVPPGMDVSSGGTLCGIPQRAGRFPLVVRAQDQTGLFDTALFILEVDSGTDLAVATFSLPPATLGAPYEATIVAVRGQPPYAWSLVSEFGALPADLTLSASSGAITGTPAKAGVFAFTVEVVDQAMRNDLQTLSIEVVEPEAVKVDEGCSCSNGMKTGSRPSSAFLATLGFLVTLFLAGRAGRRSGIAPMLTLVLMLVFAGSASAQQVPGTPYTRSVSSITYQNLASPSLLSFSNTDDGEVTIPLPFLFKYYEGQFDMLTVGTNGAIVFAPGADVSLTNETAGSSTLNNWIAPFWDDLQLFSAADHYIGTQVSGSEPNRTFTIEFRNVGRFGNSGVMINFQIRLFEGPAGRFEVDYGPVAGTGSFTATMGMEDPMGGRPILFAASNCTSSCTQADLAAMNNMRIGLVQDPGIELVATAVSAPAFGFLGASLPVEITVTNLHGAAIGPFGVQLIAAAAPDLANPTEIYASSFTLSPFQSSSTTVQAVPPASLGEGLFWVGLVVDSASSVTEVNETNNRTVSAAPVRLLEGKADLAIERVTANLTTIDAGNTVSVATRVRNVGGQPIMNAEVAIMLSTNPVVSPQDVELSTFRVSLAAGDVADQIQVVTIPAATNSGLYHLGALADPRDAIDELNESNNGRAALTSLAISGGALSIVTRSLPSAYAGVTYTGLLSAVGGGVTQTWRVTQGMLPAGLGLVPSSGELFGRPMRPESQTFTVEVSSQGETDSETLTLLVVDPRAPLTIVTRNAPPAIVGQEYSFELVGTGGAEGSTFTWSGAGLPAGLDVSAEGVLGGTPAETGTSTFAVTLANGVETTTRNISISIRDNPNLLIVPDALPSARFGEPYTFTLRSTGGRPPITWLLELGSLPEGVSLSTTGVLSGAPKEVGRFRFVVEARDAGSGGLQGKDVNTFEIVVGDVAGFSITTELLRDAVLNEGYDESVHAEGGVQPLMWMIAEGKLPPGLVASVNPTTGDFRIAGQPMEPGTSNLLLQAIDSQGRSAFRAFALRVLEQAPRMTTDSGGDGGCASTHVRETNPTGALVLVISGLVLLVALRARRPRTRSPRSSRIH